MKGRQCTLRGKEMRRIRSAEESSVRLEVIRK